VTRLGHQPALDGMRGAAILAVILLHYTWLSVGWVGVQMFFVLSGFLITTILLGDAHLPFGAYLKRFYWRRTLRIFPLYFGYLLVLSLVYRIYGEPTDFGRHAPYLFSYLFNLEFLFDWGTSKALVFHLWSLSIEEQFYLLWPCVVFLLPRRTLKMLVIALIVAGPVIRALAVVWLQTINDSPKFVALGSNNLTPCQLDAFAIGAAVALFADKLSHVGDRAFLAATGFLLVCGQLNSLIVTGSLALDTSFGFPGFLWVGWLHTWGYSLIDLWSAALLLTALRPSTVMSSILSWGPLAYVGKISYGVYVLHLVTMQVVLDRFGAAHGLVNLGRFAIYLTALLVIAGLSYRWFETPFLRLKDRAFPARTPSATPTTAM
jgi:peptidoglycan/LPS O-acetylase OafA/YrhL